MDENVKKQMDELKKNCIACGDAWGVPVEENDTYTSWFKKLVNVLPLESLEEHEKRFGTSTDGPMGPIIKIVQDRKRQLMEEMKKTSIA